MPSDENDLLAAGDGAGANANTSAPAAAATVADENGQAPAAPAAQAPVSAGAAESAAKSRKPTKDDIIAELQAQIADLQARADQPSPAPASPFNSAMARAAEIADDDGGLSAPAVAQDVGQYIVNPRRSVHHGNEEFREHQLIALTVEEAERLLQAGFVRPARESILAA